MASRGLELKTFEFKMTTVLVAPKPGTDSVAVTVPDEKLVIRPLNYLRPFKPAEYKALCKLAKVTDIYQVEALVEEYGASYRWTQIENTAANLTNFLYFYFLRQPSQDGAKKLVQFFFNGLELPDEAALYLGQVIVGASCVFWTLLFHPDKAAVRSTLQYARRKSIQDRLNDWERLRVNHPEEAAYEAGHLIFSLTILYIVNANGGSTIAQGVDAAWLNEFSPIALKRVLTYFFAYLSGIVFFRNVSDADFLKSLNFYLRNPKKLPWFFEAPCTRFRRLPLIFKSNLEGGAALWMRSWIQYPWIAAASLVLTDGWWFPPLMISLLTTIHSLYLYHSSRQHFQGDYDKLFLLIPKLYRQELAAIAASSQDQETQVQHFIFEKIEALVSKQKEREGFFCAYRDDRVVIASSVFWSLMGSVLALNFASPYWIPLTSLILPFGFYLGDLNLSWEKRAYVHARSHYQTMRRPSQALQDDKKIEAKPLALPASRRQSSGIFFITSLLIIANLIANVTSISGMANNTDAFAAALTFILVLNKEMNGMGYFFEKAAETIGDRYEQLKDNCNRLKNWMCGDAKVSTAPVVLFAVNPAPPPSKNLSAASISPSPH